MDKDENKYQLQLFSQLAIKNNKGEEKKIFRKELYHSQRLLINLFI